jgi:hypothetical protein
VVAALGFSAAFFMTAEVSVRTDSEVCFAESSAREAGILRVAAVDMAVRHLSVNGGVYGMKRNGPSKQVSVNTKEQNRNEEDEAQSKNQNASTSLIIP